MVHRAGSRGEGPPYETSITDSRPETGSVELTPYATRMASMTLVRPSSCTPRRRRGRVKQRQEEQHR